VGSDCQVGLYSTSVINSSRAGVTDVYLFVPATTFPPPQCGIAPLIRISTQVKFHRMATGECPRAPTGPPARI